MGGISVTSCIPLGPKGQYDTQTTHCSRLKPPWLTAGDGWLQVHRQTAASVVQHMALGVAGLGCEDALTHLLNYVWPNIFEMSPHVVNAVMGAVDGCRLALGPAVILNYLLQVL